MKKLNVNQIAANQVATTKEVKNAFNEVFAKPSQLVNLINKEGKKNGVLSAPAALWVSRFGRFDDKKIVDLSQLVIVDGKLCKFVRRECSGAAAVNSCKGKQIARLSGWVLVPVKVSFSSLVECFESYRKVEKHYNDIFASAEKAHARKVAKVIRLEAQLSRVSARLADAKKAI